MAFDGSIIYTIKKELERTLTGGRILKIAQPERDELLMTIKKDGTQYRLLLSANPSLPVVYLTGENKPSPLQAPAFCMLLRKHLVNGKILAIRQPSMERILDFEIEHFNEMGDLCQKTLTVELMGKYSNIILRQDNMVLDSIKHVSALISSVREVLPGREYFVPFSDDKINPFTATPEQLQRIFTQGAMPLAKTLYTGITGFSPMLAEEVLFRAGMDSERPASSVTGEEKERLFHAFSKVMDLIEDCGTSLPHIIYQGKEPLQFGAFYYETYADSRYTQVPYESISSLLFDYYAQKQRYSSLRQKSADLRQMVTTLLHKDYKKYDLQLRQIRDTEKKDKYKVYGELLTAYGYSAEPGLSSFSTTNFYTGEEISIPLDPKLSAVENGKNYFNRYAKLKRTADALGEIVVDTKGEIDYLESVLVSLEMAKTPEDIAEIKRELAQAGFGKAGKDSLLGSNAKGKAGNGKKAGKSKAKNAGSGTGKSGNSPKSSPLHYISSDGFSMYVGKNNFQNESLTFQVAAGTDWWFHAKDIPGSHVIVKAQGKELPDRTFEEAASLAAHYSKSEKSAKVEVQYTQRKNLKKPPASRPGFVVFHTYFSMAASTDISHIKEAQE